MSQTQQILDYLLTGNAITPIEALNLFGCFRLSARCFDIREIGIDVKTKTINTGKKSYASYYLEQKEIERIKDANN